MQELLKDVRQNPLPYIRFGINKAFAAFAAFCIVSDTAEEEDLYYKNFKFISSLLLLNLSHTLLFSIASTTVDTHLDETLVAQTRVPGSFLEEKKRSLSTRICKGLFTLPFTMGSSNATLFALKQSSTFSDATWQIELITDSVALVTYLGFELMFETLLQKCKREQNNFSADPSRLVQLSRWINAGAARVQSGLASSCSIPITLLSEALEFSLNTLAAKSVGTLTATWTLPDQDKEEYDLLPDYFNITSGAIAMLTFSILKSAEVQSRQNVFKYMVFFNAGLPAMIACYKWADNANIKEGTSQWKIQFLATAIGGFVSQISFDYYDRLLIKTKHKFLRIPFNQLMKNGLSAAGEFGLFISLSVVSSGITYQLFEKLLPSIAIDRTSFTVAANIFATWCLDASISKKPIDRQTYSPFIGRTLPSYSAKEILTRIPSWLALMLVVYYYTKLTPALMGKDTIDFHDEFNPSLYYCHLVITSLISKHNGDIIKNIILKNTPQLKDDSSSTDKILYHISNSVIEVEPRKSASFIEKAIKGTGLLLAAYCFAKSLTETLIEDPDYLFFLLALQLSINILTTAKLNWRNNQITYKVFNSSIIDIGLKTIPSTACWGIGLAIRDALPESSPKTGILAGLAGTSALVTEGFAWCTRYSLFPPTPDVGDSDEELHRSSYIQF